MDKKELKEYLKNNLKIEIDEFEEYQDYFTIKVSLYIENELINISEEFIYKI